MIIMLRIRLGQTANAASLCNMKNIVSITKVFPMHSLPELDVGGNSLYSRGGGTVYSYKQGWHIG